VEDPVLTHARALVARHRLSDRIGLVKVAPGPLSFPPATFDVVFSNPSRPPYHADVQPHPSTADRGVNVTSSPLPRQPRPPAARPAWYREPPIAGPAL